MTDVESPSHVVEKRSRRVALQDISEQYAGLLRQYCSRAIQRLAKRRHQPIDRVILLYALYYMDWRVVPSTGLYAQAQRQISGSMLRVEQPDWFRFTPPSILLDRLLDECDPESIQETIRELSEVDELRRELGEELAEANAVDELDDLAAADDDGGLSSAEASMVSTGALFGLCSMYLGAKVAEGKASTDLEPHYLIEVNELVCALTSSAELNALAGDCCALAACDRPTYVEGSRVTLGASESKGLVGSLFEFVRLQARTRGLELQLNEFNHAYRLSSPPLTPEQAKFHDERFGMRPSELPTTDEDGVALTFIPDDTYLVETAMRSNDEKLGEDEQFFKDEVHDYYLRQQRAGAAAAAVPLIGGAVVAHPTESGRGGGRLPGAPRPPRPQAPLMKPNRFCKVRTGYYWTQYNKTHYTRSNPPPKTVIWYEFTLFYPLLVNDRRINWSRIYRIEDVEAGFNDEYCLLVFSVGPPYADVAYRIIRRQWDPRPGGVRSSFDSKGKYRLFFRFANGIYKR